MDKLRQQMMEIVYHKETLEDYYLDYLSNETLDALGRIRAILENDDLSEFECILAIIRNLDYLNTGI